MIVVVLAWTTVADVFADEDRVAGAFLLCSLPQTNVTFNVRSNSIQGEPKTAVIAITVYFQPIFIIFEQMNEFISRMLSLQLSAAT